MPKDKGEGRPAKKAKAGMPKQELDSPVYTFVDMGIPQRGYNILGYQPRSVAAAMARRHYEREAERIQAALEALDRNRFGVRYMRHGQPVTGESAALLQAAIDRSSKVAGDAGKETPA